MSVRAKFRVRSVTHYESGCSIDMLPVTSGSAENDQFFKFTPSGELRLSTINDEAAKQFAPGDEFYLDFTKAN